MSDLQKLKSEVCVAIEESKQEIIELGETIWKNPETGFREIKTGSLVSKKFKELMLPCRENLGLTGCRADLNSRVKGPSLALLGELDAVILPAHPDASPVSGAVHACGHNAQIANMLGAAIGLKAINAEKYISGTIAFIATPAEEFLETDFRLELVRQKKIRYCGGKAELIYRGVFDDIDAAMMIHAGDKYYYAKSYNGFLTKKIAFRGRSAHAGLSPENGVNALYAANLALNGINAQRETFREQDAIRVHGVITRGGDAVNIIPDNVTLEVQVRAKTAEAVLDASGKVDRAARAGSMALGAAVEIENIPGYMPLENDMKIAGYYSDNIKMLNPSASCSAGGHCGASTDMGDLSRIMPVFHPYAPGCLGGHHTRDFRISDPAQAYVEPAKLLAMTALDLMSGDASACTEIIKLKSRLPKSQYLGLLEKISSKKVFDYT